MGNKGVIHRPIQKRRYQQRSIQLSKHKTKEGERGGRYDTEDQWVKVP